MPRPELQTPGLWPLMCVSFASSDPLLFLPAAVRTGNLAKFNQVLDQFGEKFQADGTYTLIIRLRHNVIKTGVHQGRGAAGGAGPRDGDNPVGVHGQGRACARPPHHPFLPQVCA